MIGSWYPKQYENTPAFRKAMGITALCEWCFYLAITLLAFLMANQASIFKLTASLGSVFLLYRIIAVYPFESYGGKRVYQWHKAVFSADGRLIAWFNSDGQQAALSMIIKHG